MKRYWFLIIVACLSNIPGQLFAEEASNAAAIADRQEAEERYRRLNSAVEDLTTAQVKILKKLADVTDELQRLREEVNRLGSTPPANFASPEDLKRLADRVQELERKREKDKDFIIEEIKKLEKISLSTREPAIPSPKPAPPRKTEGNTEVFLEYIVKPKDSFAKIAAECTKQGHKVTVEDLMKANPTVKPERLYPKMKINIPAPASLP